MKNEDGSPQKNKDELSDPLQPASENTEKESKKSEKAKEKKKKKRNWWPLKALLITLVLSAAVNLLSELSLTGAHVFVIYVVTAVILTIGVFFDIIGTAATSCEIQPYLSMAARKVRGAKTAVKLCKNSDTVSSICNDVIGDICGIVSGVCAATIVSAQTGNNQLWLSVLVYAVVSTATVTLKALGKSYAVKNANKIIFSAAKFLCIFNKEG